MIFVASNAGTVDVTFLLTLKLTKGAQRSTYLRTVVGPIDLMHSESSNTDLGEGL